MKYFRFLLPVIFFVVLEFVLFIFDIPKSYKPHSTPLQFMSTLDKSIDYANLSSTSIDFIYDRNPRGYFRANNTVEHITNSAGYRGPEIPLQKLPDSLRVLFLGDSFTFGEGVYFEDTYPEQFEGLANEQHIFDKKVEAINLGVGGFETEQEYRLLRFSTSKADLDPDLIVVGYAMNDAGAPLFLLNGAEEIVRQNTGLENFINAKKDMASIFKFSRALRIVRGWYVGKEITEKTIEYYHDLYNDENASWLATQKAIEDFGEYQEESGDKVVFVIFPMFFQLNDYPFEAEEQKVKNLLEQSNVSYINLREALVGYNGPELWVHPTDQHPNEIVHKIAAERLLEYFKNHGE